MTKTTLTSSIISALVAAAVVTLIGIYYMTNVIRDAKQSASERQDDLERRLLIAEQRLVSSVVPDSPDELSAEEALQLVKEHEKWKQRNRELERRHRELGLAPPQSYRIKTAHFRELEVERLRVGHIELDDYGMLGAEGEKAGLVLRSNDGRALMVTAAGILVTRPGPSVAKEDALKAVFKRSVLLFGVGPDGEPYLKFVNQSGKEIVNLAEESGAGVLSVRGSAGNESRLHGDYGLVTPKTD